jgi:hypothetical protein
MSLQELRAHDRVKAWFAGAHHDEQPDAQQDRYLEILAGFLSHVDHTPDELVAFCFLRKKDTGERFLSQKRRVEVNEWIAGHVDARGWVAKEAVANANVIRSFLVHNGVLIQGKVWTGG